jgi:hypothetical protein
MQFQTIAFTVAEYMQTRLQPERQHCTNARCATRATTALNGWP